MGESCQCCVLSVHCLHAQPPDRDKPPVMTTVEIKPSSDLQIVEEGEEGTDKENVKKLDDENEDLKIDLKKKTDMIGDGPRNDKIFNNVSPHTLAGLS